MSSAKKDDERRLFEMTVDIHATPEDVWRALTEAEHHIACDRRTVHDRNVCPGTSSLG